MHDFSWTTFLRSLVGSGATAWLVVKGLGSHLADRWLARYKGELDKEFEKYRDALEQKRKRMKPNSASVRMSAKPNSTPSLTQ